MRRFHLAILLAFGGLAVPAAMPSAAFAQGAETANISFGGLKGDTSLPVTVTSKELTIDEGEGTAIFTGDVLVIQGELRLSAQEVQVEYDDEAQKVRRLWAIGDVLLVNAQDAAQSQTAEYLISDGIVTMYDNVVLTQGTATFSAQKLIANVNTGLGKLEGGVTTTFTPNAVQKAAP